MYFHTTLSTVYTDIPILYSSILYMYVLEYVLEYVCEYDILEAVVVALWRLVDRNGVCMYVFVYPSSLPTLPTTHRVLGDSGQRNKGKQQ